MLSADADVLRKRIDEPKNCLSPWSTKEKRQLVSISCFAQGIVLFPNRNWKLAPLSVKALTLAFSRHFEVLAKRSC